MSKLHRLQRGAVDILAAAVGLTILSIAAIGTSTALIYGREALIQQEHHKAAAFALRGELDALVGRMQMNINQYATNGAYGSWQPDPRNPRPLDLPSDRDGRIRQTMCNITLDNVEPKDDPATDYRPDYWLVTMSATWREVVIAGPQSQSRFENVGPDQSITLVAPVLLRAAIG